MGVGTGERRIYRRMRATRARRRVVWQVLGDMIRLGWVIVKSKKVVQVSGKKNPNTGGILGAGFCMGAQMRTDSPSYKILTPVFWFFMPGTCNDRDKQAHRKEAGSRLVRFG